MKRILEEEGQHHGESQQPPLQQPPQSPAHKTPSMVAQEIIRKYYPMEVGKDVKFYAKAPTASAYENGLVLGVRLFEDWTCLGTNCVLTPFGEWLP